MRVNICGIWHEVIECDDHFNTDLHFGQIDYDKCEIRNNKNMHASIQEEAICHEMVHGILVHLGYNERSADETFVQSLANAIMQGFEIRGSFDPLKAVIERGRHADTATEEIIVAGDLQL